MPAKGQKLTEAQKEHLSKIQKGKPKSEAFREKCRLRMFGKPSPMKGRKQSEKQKEMMRLRCGENHYNWGRGINAVHGDAREGKRTAEYNIWITMKQRCSNPKTNGYINYGGRGIIVCERWLNSFENFLKDMGRKPSGDHSIDRIDNDGNYEPNNCRWATQKEQYENSRLQRKPNGQFEALK
jgi:hypothetical protein